MQGEIPNWGGHELCGIVEKIVGQSGKSLSIGDRVAVALMPRCGCCSLCRQGLNNHCAYENCEVSDGLPSGPRGLSDQLLIEPYKAFRLAPTVPPIYGALVEPIACVLRSIQQASPQVGDTVFVLGAGTMGLIHTVLLVQSACRVIVFDNDTTSLPWQLEPIWSCLYPN